MRKGLTIIELVISLSLFSLLLSSVFFALHVYLKAWGRTAGRCESVQKKLLVIERVCQDLRSAENAVYSLENGRVGRNNGKSTAYLTDKGEVKGFSVSTADDNGKIIKLDEYQTVAYLRGGQ